ncbi:uncharacterized protein TNCV_3819861 [Trichonephila clavipes]|nr:uncharacterized protein TNCV_3819861 [Trichonephila clavipes]
MHRPLRESKTSKNKISTILEKGRVQLHKWGSSHPELALNSNADNEFENLIEIKTLVMSWKSQEDYFAFKIAFEFKDCYTKRCVISTIARLFVTLGLLGPVVAKGAIFIRGLWSLKIDWIDELSSETTNE